MQHLAEIHDVGAGLRRRLDEPAVERDLQAADVVLQHERDEARVVVHADALARVGVARLGRVADDLQMRIAARQHEAVEVVERLAQAERERSQHRQADAVHRRHPREHRRLHRGQPRGPLIRATQAAATAARPWIDAQRGLLGPDVELLAPVADALGALVAEHGVAAKVR